jgi:hypothetical protein
MLRAAQEPKHGLDHTKLVIALQRLFCFSKDKRMSSHKISIGGRSLSWGVPCPIATTSVVGHEL